MDSQALASLAQAIQGAVTVHDSKQSSYKDGYDTEVWIAEQCGTEEVHDSLPGHWR